MTGCKTPEPFGSVRPTRSIADLQATAQRFHSVISEPRFERTPTAIAQTTTNVIERYRAEIDAIGCRSAETANFTNTVAALDQAEWESRTELLRRLLLESAATNAAVRAAGAQSAAQLAQAVIDARYRQDVYARVKAVAGKDKSLKGEDARLLNMYVARGKNNGLELEPAKQQRIEDEWKQLVVAQMEFLTNLSTPPPQVKLTRAALKGTSNKFLQQHWTKVGPDEHLVPANTYLGELRLEQTRKQLWLTDCSATAERNRAPVQRIMELRSGIAQQLGYRSWAEYELRGRLAGNPTNALAFCKDVSSRARPGFESELAELTRLKVLDTRDPNARIELWDLQYYSEVRQRHQYGSAMRRLASYFPEAHVLDSMFDVCERVFGIKIEPVQAADAWADGVRLYAVSDANSGEPLGLVYFDLYARPGKRKDSFTQPLVAGKLLPDGTRQCPVATVEMSFSPPMKGKRYDLWPESVRSLYHEFGHALHEVLSRAKYGNLAGTDVSRDYVEVPSELLGRFPLDRAVLDVMTRRNSWPSRKMYPNRYEQLRKLETERNRLLEPLAMAWAMTDLALHMNFNAGSDAIALSNRLLAENYLPFPPEAAPITGYHNFINYDAAVYSHRWCEAIAVDLLAEMAKAPDGLLDREVGLRLRREIFETGNARPPRVSLETFLGRPYSLPPSPR